MKITRECINIKGMHDICRSLEVIKLERAKTHSSLSRIEQTTKPIINEKLVELDLRKERRRFQRQDRSLERSLRNVAKMRSMLLGKKIKNQRLMALRKGLQASRYLVNSGEICQGPPGQQEREDRRFKKIRLTY